MYDRTDLNSKLGIDYFFPPFFSVLLPELGRPNYITKCIESIHKYSDMPVEIILHDDGSGKEKQTQLFNDLRSKVSTMILNCGSNTGLARSMNRCRSMASSEYLIGFNVDVYMTSSFLKNMKAALDLPYCGMVNVVDKISNPIYINPDGVKIGMKGEGGICHCYGIKSSVWDEVGGWDENVQTTSSDVGFTGEVFGHGYFVLTVEGTTTNEISLKSEDGKTNIGKANPDYIDSCCAVRGDNNTPILFSFPKSDHDIRCENRRIAIWEGVNNKNAEEKLFPHWYNANFLCDQTSKLYKNNRSIDWDFAKTHGHDKWKDHIKKDFGL